VAQQWTLLAALVHFFTISTMAACSIETSSMNLTGVAGNCRSWRAGRPPLERPKRSRLVAPNANYTVPQSAAAAAIACVSKHSGCCCIAAGAKFAVPKRLESLGSVDCCRSMNTGWPWSSCNSAVCMHSCHATAKAALQLTEAAFYPGCTAAAAALALMPCLQKRIAGEPGA
jgi:hypothetical protein